MKKYAFCLVVLGVFLLSMALVYAHPNKTEYTVGWVDVTTTGYSPPIAYKKTDTANFACFKCTTYNYTIYAGFRVSPAALDGLPVAEAVMIGEGGEVHPEYVQGAAMKDHYYRIWVQTPKGSGSGDLKFAP